MTENLTTARTGAIAQVGVAARIVKCPTCSKSAVYSESNPFRPFCSRNCQTGDLAAWATDEYRVPGQTMTSVDEELTGLED